MGSQRPRETTARAQEALWRERSQHADLEQRQTLCKLQAEAAEQRDAAAAAEERAGAAAQEATQLRAQLDAARQVPEQQHGDEAPPAHATANGHTENGAVSAEDQVMELAAAAQQGMFGQKVCEVQSRASAGLISHLSQLLVRRWPMSATNTACFVVRKPSTLPSACAQVAEFKQRLVRAKKQVMALKKQAADATEERDAALAELTALREAQPAGVWIPLRAICRSADLHKCVPAAAWSAR